MASRSARPASCGCDRHERNGRVRAPTVTVSRWPRRRPAPRSSSTATPATTTCWPSWPPPTTPTWSASRRWPATPRSTARPTTPGWCAICWRSTSRSTPERPGRSSPRPRPRRWSTARAASTAPTSPLRRGPLDSADAVGFIVGTHPHADPGCWLVATGPLTNVALALRAAPDLADAGRGHLADGRRDASATARLSPSSTSGPTQRPRPSCSATAGRCVMAGLDVTHQFTATPERIERVAATGGLVAATLAPLLRFFSGTYLARTDAGVHRRGPDARRAGGARPHPSRAVHPGRPPRGGGDLGRAHQGHDGDRRRAGSASRPAPNCDVLTAVDADAAFEALLEAITSGAR